MSQKSQGFVDDWVVHGVNPLVSLTSPKYNETLLIYYAYLCKNKAIAIKVHREHDVTLFEGLVERIHLQSTKALLPKYKKDCPGVADEIQKVWEMLLQPQYFSRAFECPLLFVTAPEIYLAIYFSPPTTTTLKETKREPALTESKSTVPSSGVKVSIESEFEVDKPASPVSQLLKKEGDLRAAIDEAKMTPKLSNQISTVCWEGIIKCLSAKQKIQDQLLQLDEAKDSSALNKLREAKDQDLYQEVRTELQTKFRLALDAVERERTKLVKSTSDEKFDGARVEELLEMDLQWACAKRGVETYNTDWFRNQNAVANLTNAIPLLTKLKSSITQKDFLAELEQGAKKIGGELGNRLMFYREKHQAVLAQSSKVITPTAQSQPFTVPPP